MQHSPSPWFSGSYMIENSHGEIICMQPNSKQAEFLKADGKLIASAPDLLISLKDCVDALRVHAPDSWAYSQAVKLIEKLDIEQYPNSMEK